MAKNPEYNSRIPIINPLSKDGKIFTTLSSDFLLTPAIKKISQAMFDERNRNGTYTKRFLQLDPVEQFTVAGIVLLPAVTLAQVIFN